MSLSIVINIDFCSPEVELKTSRTEERATNDNYQGEVTTVIGQGYTIVAESILFVWLFRAAHDLTSWPSG